LQTVQLQVFLAGVTCLIPSAATAQAEADLRTSQLDPVMTKTSEPPMPIPDVDTVRTYRQLRLMRALFEIDDPELERALTVIVDRLAAACASKSA
jgi:hypothetical protein